MNHTIRNANSGLGIAALVCEQSEDIYTCMYICTRKCSVGGRPVAIVAQVSIRASPVSERAPGLLGLDACI